jgi:thymidine phosphorylase
LAGELLCMGGLATDTADADARLRSALDSGAAAEKFARMVAALGGPKDFIEHSEAYLPQAPIQRAVRAGETGYVAAMDVRGLGNAIVELGGGRKVDGQKLDLAVGLSALLGRGQRVERGESLAIVHARSEADAELAVAAVRRAYVIADEPPPALPLYQWYASTDTQA